MNRPPGAESQTAARLIDALLAWLRELPCAIPAPGDLKRHPLVLSLRAEAQALLLAAELAERGGHAEIRVEIDPGRSIDLVLGAILTMRRDEIRSTIAEVFKA